MDFGLFFLMQRDEAWSEQAVYDSALEQIGKELDGPLVPLTTEEERRQVHRWVLEVVRRGNPQPARVERADLLGGLAVAPG